MVVRKATANATQKEKPGAEAKNPDPSSDANSLAKLETVPQEVISMQLRQIKDTPIPNMFRRKRKNLFAVFLEGILNDTAKKIRSDSWIDRYDTLWRKERSQRQRAALFGA